MLESTFSENDRTSVLPKSGAKSWKSSLEYLNKGRYAESGILDVKYDEKLMKLRGAVLVDKQSENEAKADKLNRTQQTVLDNVKTQVWRETISFEREHKQAIRQFRARSARVFRDSTFSPHSRGAKLLKKRKSQSQDALRSNCDACGKIQDAMRAYEKETLYGRNLQDDNNKRIHQTLCLFNDRQIKTFIHALETEYCAQMPAITEMLQDSKFYLVQQQFPERHMSGYGRPNSFPEEEVRLREKVKTFCKNQEIFNKKYPLAKVVQLQTDRARIEQAVAVRQVR